MKCPVCSNELVQYAAGKFFVEICRDGCSGIWFDHDELAKCDQHNESFPDELLQVRKVLNVVIDKSKKRNCPKCSGEVMKRVIIDAENRFEIDQCPACKGHWLDAGEMAHLRKLDDAEAQRAARMNEYNKRMDQNLNDVDSRFMVKKLIKTLLG